MHESSPGMDDWADSPFHDIPVSSSSYEDFSRLADNWIDAAEHEISKPQPNGLARSLFDRINTTHKRRHFSCFRKRVRTKSRLGSALIELFLLSRIRMFVLGYLSVQEGEDFEGADEYESNAPLLISQFLAAIGKRSHLTVGFRKGRFGAAVSFDPLRHLRRIYSRMLKIARRDKPPTLWDRIAIESHRLKFVVMLKLTEWTLRACSRRLVGRDLERQIRMFIRGKSVRRSIATAIYVLFPSAQSLGEADWLKLLDRIESHFPARIASLIESIPDHSVNDHGLIKLCKVAFGTIAGRTSVRDEHEGDTVEFIFNTLRLAYSWGVTYPLVDNVLDSANTSEKARSDLARILDALFADDAARTLAVDVAPNVSEVHARLSEVLSLVPGNRALQARRMLRHLLEAHRRDAARRLSKINAPPNPQLYRDVMVDTALKSALVRLATMEVCGISVDHSTIARNMIRSLFNQLGDDLWDIYEDYDDDRVTPYTLFLTNGGDADPFLFYVRYSELLAKNESPRRQMSIFMGVCETFRDSLLALKDRTDDALGVADAIRKTLHTASGAESARLIPDVPHVDFDAVLFSLESTMLEIIRK